MDQLKKLVAERDLEIKVMEEVAAKNVWSAPPCKVLRRDDDDSCLNVSGLSGVDCCCSQAMFSNNGSCISTVLARAHDLVFSAGDGLRFALWTR